MSLQSFSRFLELPKELQIQIWREAIEEEYMASELGRVSNYRYTMREGENYLHLESPHSGQRIYPNSVWHVYWRNFFGVMGTNCFFRLVGLEY